MTTLAIVKDGQKYTFNSSTSSTNNKIPITENMTFYCRKQDNGEPSNADGTLEHPFYNIFSCYDYIRENYYFENNGSALKSDTKHAQITIDYQYIGSAGNSTDSGTLNVIGPIEGQCADNIIKINAPNGITSPVLWFDNVNIEINGNVTIADNGLTLDSDLTTGVPNFLLTNGAKVTVNTLYLAPQNITVERKGGFVKVENNSFLLVKRVGDNFGVDLKDDTYKNKIKCIYECTDHSKIILGELALSTDVNLTMSSFVRDRWLNNFKLFEISNYSDIEFNTLLNFNWFGDGVSDVGTYTTLAVYDLNYFSILKDNTGMISVLVDQTKSQQANKASNGAIVVKPS